MPYATSVRGLKLLLLTGLVSAGLVSGTKVYSVVQMFTYSVSGEPDTLSQHLNEPTRPNATSS